MNFALALYVSRLRFFLTGTPFASDVDDESSYSLLLNTKIIIIYYNYIR